MLETLNPLLEELVTKCLVELGNPLDVMQAFIDDRQKKPAGLKEENAKLKQENERLQKEINQLKSQTSPTAPAAAVAALAVLPAGLIGARPAMVTPAITMVYRAPL